MSMIIQTITIIIAVLFMSLAFLFSGMALYNYIIKNHTSHPLPLRIGAGYFLGQSLFIALWIFLAHLIKHAWLSLIISLFGMFLVIVTCRDFKKQLIETVNTLKEHITLNLILFVAVEIITLAVWLRLYDGSDHSDFYGAIARYIYSTNTIPVLGLHYGQSILSAAVALITKNNIHNLALNLFLSISITMLVIATYGFLKKLGVERRFSFIGTYILFFGNYALTLTHGVSLSSLSPLIITGYTDDIHSIGTFIIFLTWLESSFNAPDARQLKQFSTYLCPIIMGISWNIVAPQNIIYGLAILGVLFLIYFLKKGPRLKVSFILAAVFFVSVIFGTMCGGAFSPSKYQNKVEGLQNVEAYKFKIHYQPEMPFTIARTAITPLWHIRPPHKGQFPAVSFWYLEENIWDSIRLCFYPLMGLLLLWYFLRREAQSQNPYIIILRKFLLAASITFITGYATLFFVNLGSLDKWGLSKLMTSSYYMGMVALLIALNIYLIKSKSRYKKTYVWLFFIIVIIGPTASILMAVKYSLFPPEYVLSILERLKVLMH